jgi:hypothetical protein
MLPYANTEQKAHVQSHLPEYPTNMFYSIHCFMVFATAVGNNSNKGGI